MDFKGKILVVTGCSHTYGDYLNQQDNFEKECHDRSWASKLAHIGNFTSSINLSFGGSSNARSFRVIKEYIIDKRNNIQDAVVMIGLTEPMRFELPSQSHLALNDDRSFKGKYYINMFAPWQINNDRSDRMQDFLNNYYGIFTVDAHTKHLLYLDLLTMHLFLKNYGIEHYFPCFLGNKQYFDVYDLTNIPIIDFDGLSGIEFAKRNGFKVGRDICPEFDCNHLDHDGNEFLAQYLLNKIKEMKNGI
jgi:hypothetical protein